MIAPTYQRAQLWPHARGRFRTTVLAALIGATCFAGASYAWIAPPAHGLSRSDRTVLRMRRAVQNTRPSWSAHPHTYRCPVRLGDVMDVPLDAWGHAFTYTCTPSRLEIRSGGEDGVFGTADDLRSYR